jgi:DNA-binding response OmpR family regulator
VTAAAPRVLVVDDEAQLRSLIAYALTANGFQVSSAATAAEALEHVARETTDLIVLDVVLPDGNGIELCPRLKRHTSAPVVFLTVMSDQRDVIAGLRAGGDDYLAKPFSVEELVLRINAVLRRTPPDQGTIEIGALVLRMGDHVALVDEAPIDLTPLEFRFVWYLAANRDRIVPTSELVHEVWQVDDLGGHDPIVKTMVYRIRQKLRVDERERIELRNVRGVGYQLRPISRTG